MLRYQKISFYGMGAGKAPSQRMQQKKSKWVPYQNKKLLITLITN